jgi:hypothetical protein
MKITNVRIMIVGGDGFANVSDLESRDNGTLLFIDERGGKHMLSPAVQYHVIDESGLPENSQKPW